MYSDRDPYGPFRSCLQCGYLLDLRPVAPVPQVRPAPREVAYANAD